MILKEQNNQKKTLTDGVLDINHEQENTPSTNGKASPRLSLSLSQSWLHLSAVCAGLWGTLGHSPVQASLLPAEVVVQLTANISLILPVSQKHLAS